uniref:Chlororespiratory reduction31 n=1 Tax=Kalanchoe fedtschenkoi TaxID=63787 RepID=A0A7N1A861_KALFE
AAPSINRSSFLGHAIRSNRLHLRPPRTSSNREISAKFNLYEILGGRGLCNGEKGLQLELQRETATNTNSDSDPESETQPDTQSGLKVSNLPDDSFDKEFLGLTGGFPGGENGLRKFIESNPPPPKPKPGKKAAALLTNANASGKPKAPELLLLMPGMIAIVKNPNNPFYMYCGIVQRITDGKTGVLFEGGVWDRMMTPPPPQPPSQLPSPPSNLPAQVLRYWN